MFWDVVEQLILVFVWMGMPLTVYIILDGFFNITDKINDFVSK